MIAIRMYTAFWYPDKLEPDDESRRHWELAGDDSRSRWLCATRVLPLESPEQSTAERTIRRLFHEAKGDGDQAPAIEASVVLRGFPATLTGALSPSQDGGLRLMSPLMGDGAAQLVEQFFGYEDVVIVAVKRPVRMTESRIIRG